MRAKPERLRGVFTTRHYTYPILPLPLPLPYQEEVAVLFQYVIHSFFSLDAAIVPV